MKLTCVVISTSLALLASSAAGAFDVKSAQVNWLIGGRWVRDGVPCLVHTPQGHDVPQGAEFSPNSARVWLPAELGIETPQAFSVDYRFDEHDVMARLVRSDGQAQIVTFHKLSGSSALDDQGLTFRRCGIDLTS